MQTPKKEKGPGPEKLSKYAQKLRERNLGLANQVEVTPLPPPAPIRVDPSQVTATIPYSYVPGQHWYTMPVTDDGEMLFLIIKAVPTWLRPDLKGGVRVVCLVGQSYSKGGRAVNAVTSIEAPPEHAR